MRDGHSEADNYPLPRPASERETGRDGTEKENKENKRGKREGRKEKRGKTCSSKRAVLLRCALSYAAAPAAPAAAASSICVPTCPCHRATLSQLIPPSRSRHKRHAPGVSGPQALRNWPQLCGIRRGKAGATQGRDHGAAGLGFGFRDEEQDHGSEGLGYEACEPEARAVLLRHRCRR
jgi:hypothetical protein